MEKEVKFRAKCAIPGCTNVKLNNDTSDYNRSFFQFPSHSKDKWISLIKAAIGDKYQHNEHGRICADHFEYRHFSNSKKTRLNKFAFPSIFKTDNSVKQSPSCNLTAIASDVPIEESEVVIVDSIIPSAPNTSINSDLNSSDGTVPHSCVVPKPNPPAYKQCRAKCKKVDILEVIGAKSIADLNGREKILYDELLKSRDSNEYNRKCALYWRRRFKKFSRFENSIGSDALELWTGQINNANKLRPTWTHKTKEIGLTLFKKKCTNLQMFTSTSQFAISKDVTTF